MKGLKEGDDSAKKLELSNLCCATETFDADKPGHTSMRNYRSESQ